MSLRKSIMASTIPIDPLELYLSKANYTNSALISVITNFYNDCVQNGWFAKMEYCYLVVADDTTSTATILEQCAYNMVNANQFKLTYYNNPTADQIGVQWSNANFSYASTNFIPSIHHKTTTLLQSCAGIYQTTNAGNSVDFGSNGVDNYNNSYFMACNLGTDLYDAINSPTQYRNLPLSTIGLNTMIRDNSDYQFIVRRNGAGVYQMDFAYSYYGFCDLPILIGALGPISLNNTFSSDNKFCHHFMASFNTAELIAYETRVNVLQGEIETALGLAVGSRKKY
jgi:hypothetical protein